MEYVYITTYILPTPVRPAMQVRGRGGDVRRTPAVSAGQERFNTYVPGFKEEVEPGGSGLRDQVRK